MKNSPSFTAGIGIATQKEQDKILLKNPKNASTRLSMNGKSPKILTTPPFVLRLV
jgi:hypothetical protein